MKIEETKTHKIYKFGFLNFKLTFRKKRENNNIYIINKNKEKVKVKKVKGLHVKFRGSNSTVILHKPILNFDKSTIELGSNCVVEIKSSPHTANNLRILGREDNVSCSIDENFSCTKDAIIFLHKEPNLKVTIGKDCMFGSNVQIRTTDAHTIFDNDTKQVLNYGKDVVIGNHVWLAREVSILKGVKIPDNCIIGTHSVVTKSLEEENALYVGLPAKKIKSNVNWSRKPVQDYLNNF